MSFFDFEASSLEQNLESGRQESEDLAVYTWGEESYDGLGDALQEGGDELNNETFGGSGAVGQSITCSLPLRERTPAQERTYAAPKFPERANPLSLTWVGISPALASAPSAPHSLESIWDDRSPFSMLRGANGAARVTDHRPSSTSRHLASPTTSSLAHGQQTLADHHRTPDQQLHQPISHGANSFGARTVQEIEAEMRLAAQQARQRQELELRQRERELRLAEEQQLSQQQQQQQQQQLRDQDRLRLLQLQQQQLIQQEQQLRLHQVHQQQVTPPPPPPPRMSLLPRTQSPRFHQQHQHQQQILMLQQEQERQQQERLKELQERLRMEELERQLRAQQLSQLQQQPSLQARRQASYADLQALQQRRTHSPAGAAFATGSNGGGEVNQQDAPFLPQSIQLQQRLLSEMAQAEFMRDMQGISQAEQEALRAEAMRKIMETERMEEKRRRKASKIAYMSRYNDLMTQSDKDFITRIQVSQLVTQDPYAEDFYAQVYGAILRSRMGQPGADSERVLKFGSGGGVGLGMPGHKTGSRRPSAMQKMETQVERIVSNARMREREKGMHSLHSLQGALGKTSGRSYKAAPRQLLQHASHISREDGQGHSLSTNSDGAVREAAKLGREALGDVAGQDGVVRKDPLTRREVLVAIESLYDCVLNIEQLRRNQPFEEDDEAVAAWQEDYESLVEEIWVGLNVLVPLETSDPHPFISLLTTAKGKRILPRLSRHIQPARMLTLLTLLVACFSQLDVVKYAHLLDLPEDSHLHTQSRTPSSNGDANPPDRDEVERQTQAFLGSVLQSILPVVAKAELRLIAGLLGLLLDRSDVVMIAQTRPGIAILTLFMSRVEIIKQGMSGIPESEVLTPEDAEQWQLMFDHLFQLLAPHFLLLFPSTRRALQLAATPTQHNVHGRMPPQSPGAEMLDQPVWQFLAALALHASTEQQSTLVAGLREKVLENVASAQKGWGVVDEEEREAKLANVNLFLHALGLDSSQITI
ncbi:topoisomerase II-associated protein PAT1 [Boletus edulis BED1]|uniref:Topoisomerase II-associated protein PAT1 n=1 Tax=Boletus edulis BED1 TaxID=1328754 RepID=A0AAD4GKB8_BOLED|nr:topoisomerase II-associated protein PAT1 [Boletus edulis BED1]